MTSGIENLKKKSKIKLDEMFSNKEAGYPETQEVRNQNQQNSAFSPTEVVKESEIQETNQLLTQATTLSLEKHEASVNIQSDPPLSINQSLNSKVPTHKMTFQLTAEIYKAFNNLYATRMLQGRKTDKSEMICEAIQWLLKKEEDSAH